MNWCIALMAKCQDWLVAWSLKIHGQKTFSMVGFWLSWNQKYEDFVPPIYFHHISYIFPSHFHPSSWICCLLCETEFWHDWCGEVKNKGASKKHSKYPIALKIWLTLYLTEKLTVWIISGTKESKRSQWPILSDDFWRKTISHFRLGLITFFSSQTRYQSSIVETIIFRIPFFKQIDYRFPDFLIAPGSGKNESPNPVSVFGYYLIRVS